MQNSFESDGRGPSDRQLLGVSIVTLLVSALVVTGLLLKSGGRLEDYTRVVAELTNVGDGLPAKSDVKYQGVLVGSVDDVTPSQRGGLNYVKIDLKSDLAHTVPRNVTARVVPSNAFAVSSVQLVDHGPAPAIANGARIQEDTELPTVLFQTTISKLRDILAATGRGREDHTVGIFAVVGAATEGRRVTLLNAGAQLTRLLDQLNAIVATDPGPSTLSALVDAASGLKSTAPDLLDALHQAVKPMQTIAEKKVQLRNLLTGGLTTLGTARAAVDNHIDQMIGISHDLLPALGVLAQHSDQFLPITLRLRGLSEKFYSDAWDAENDQISVRANVSFTPSFTYTRADCPKYGELKGPSCYTAPELVVRPDLPDVLLPQNYKPPPDLAPPPGTVVGPDGNLHAAGPPVVNPYPNLADPNPPLPWWQPVPVPRVPGTANPDDQEPPPPPALPAIPPAPVAPNPFQPASFGGNVGPVGSEHERAQLGVITGQPATPATQLLLGPVARGTNVVASRGIPGEGSR